MSLSVVVVIQDDMESWSVECGNSTEAVSAAKKSSAPSSRI